MKKIKKMLALIVGLCMVLCMGVTAFAAAATETGTITIENPVEGQSYNAYRVFDLESYDSSTGAYSYVLNSDFEEFAKQDTIRGVYITLTDSGSRMYVNWNGAASAAEFAQKAITWARNNGIAPAGTIASASAAAKTITDLPLGYYAVDSSLGTVCSLDTLNPNATIKEKNDVPSVEKTVFDKKTGNYGSTNTAQIGDTVEFKTVVNIGTGPINLVLHDEMDDCFDLNPASFAITVNNETVSSDYYTIDASPKDGDTFEISFNNDYVSTLKADSDIVVKYTAVLNEKAQTVTESTENGNKTWLVYGDNNSKTTESKTKTLTFAVDVVKTNTEDSVIDGAKFKLYDSLTGGTQIQLIKVSEDAAAGEYVYRVADMSSDDDKAAVEANIAAGTDYVTAGKLTIKGLNADNYYLEETEAPKGYNRLTGRVLINLTNATTDNKAVIGQGGTLGIYQSGGVKVVNNTGTLLPSTGGSGTMMIYAVGAAVIALAFGYLAFRKFSGKKTADK